MRSAAWRISMWATLAFACGTMVVFIFLHQFVAGDIQRRTDAWLAGEAGVLSDVADANSERSGSTDELSERLPNSRAGRCRTSREPTQG